LSWASNAYGNFNYQMAPFENVNQIIEKEISSLLAIRILLKLPPLSGF